MSIAEFLWFYYNVAITPKRQILWHWEESNFMDQFQLTAVKTIPSLEEDE